jgi:hypothetical protein
MSATTISSEKDGLLQSQSLPPSSGVGGTAVRVGGSGPISQGLPPKHPNQSLLHSDSFNLKTMKAKAKLEAEEQKERPTDLFHIHNLAIPMAYFSVGMVSSLLATPLNVYMVEFLNAEPAMQNTIGILKTLPWSLKMVFGFVSDACPINGNHRKPYLVTGSLIYSSALLTYALCGIHNAVFLAVCICVGTMGLIQMDVMADTMCVERSKYEEEESKGQMQASCYSVRFTGSVVGAMVGALVSNQKQWGWGLTFLQVAFLNGIIPLVLVTPLLWVLKERFQKKKHHKELLVTPTASPAPSPKISITPAVPTERSKLLDRANSFSSMENGSGSLRQLENSNRSNSFKEGEMPRRLSIDRRPSPGLEYAEQSPLMRAKAKLTRMLSFWLIEEEEVDSTVGVRQQIREIWDTVQLQAVWKPMAFVYIYNLFQVPNVGWQSYLQLTLHFPSWVLGLSVLLGSIMTLAGILAYKRFFFKSSWRAIYVGTTMLVAFFSCLQLILIFQINTKYLHMSNYFFSLGDDVISAYINGIQFLPVCIMYMRLCPDGAEGASYSMLTTFSNVAFVVSSDIGNALSSVWDVSNDALRSNNLSGLWKISLLTSVASVLPLCLLFLLPKSPEDQDRLAKDQHRSRIGGAVFLIVLFASLGWSISSAIAELVANNS